MHDAAREAEAQRPDVVVAAGGDGTVGAVAGALAGTDTPMGVLPMGTLNHFARDAGIPADLQEAARVIASAAPRVIDVAEVNGRVFVNNSSIGAYPRAVQERQRRLAMRPRARSFRRLAMVQAAWVVLLQLPTQHVLLSIDGRPVERRTPFVLVGNNEYATGLGDLGHRASLSAGCLNIVHMRRPGRRAILGLAARAVVGRLDASRDFETRMAKEVTVQLARRLVRVALDGEVVRLSPPLHYRVRPGALRILAPAVTAAAANGKGA
jgi:diacylglycerol kinase family enzyme